MAGIGSFGDMIGDVSKKISKTSFKEFSSTYLKPSGDELSAAAKRTLINGLDSSSMIKKADVQAYINTSPFTVGGNADYIGATGKLLKSLDNKDMDQYKEIAQDISQRFNNDDKYLNLLIEAEGTIETAKNAINGLSNDTAKTLFTNNFTDKIDKNPKLNKYVQESQKNFIGEKAYQVNGLKGYFNTDDPVKNQARIGAAAGTYMGAMTTARLAHGGGLTKNEYGERDIVGIPFI